MNDLVPTEIQRFILTSIDSVPHLEAILLLRDSNAPWTAAGMAQSLFIPEKKASEVLADLCKAGFAHQDDDGTFRYHPISPKLRETLDELSQIYPRHLVQISHLIHAKIDRQAQSFGDAFKWKKE